MNYSFERWLENRLEQKEDDVRKLWTDILRALVGELDPKEALSTSLSKIGGGKGLIGVQKIIQQQFQQRIENLVPKIPQGRGETKDKFHDPRGALDRFWQDRNKTTDQETVAPTGDVSDLMKAIFGKELTGTLLRGDTPIKPPVAQVQGQQPIQGQSNQPDMGEPGAQPPQPDMAEPPQPGMEPVAPTGEMPPDPMNGPAPGPVPIPTGGPQQKKPAPMQPLAAHTVHHGQSIFEQWLRRRLDSN